MASNKGETSGESTKNDEEVIPGYKDVTNFSSVGTCKGTEITV